MPKSWQTGYNKAKDGCPKIILKEQHMEEKSMSWGQAIKEVFTSSTVGKTMGAIFLLGFLGGAIYFYPQYNNKVEVDHYQPSQLTGGLKYDNVRCGRDTCVVLEDNAEVYNKPSVIEGQVLTRLSKGLKVELVAIDNSLDTNEFAAVTAVDLEFKKVMFFGRREFLPAGSRVTLIAGSGTEKTIKGKFYLEGRERELRFEREQLRLAHLGQWKKIRWQGQECWVKFNSLSEPMLM